MKSKPSAILLFEIQTGVAGDMILGALFDLGLDFPAWKAQMDTLALPGVVLRVEKVLKHGISASRFQVELPPEHAHRGLPEIRTLIARADMPQAVKDQAVEIFTRIAEVEAGIHGVPVDKIHFHELGALDAIVDILGACLGFDMLGITDFYSTPLTFGSGTVKTAHGRMTVPVPATLALSLHFPSIRTVLPGELCTPTGTAIVTTLARPMPTGWVGKTQKIGYGAGSRDLPDTANVLRLCLLTTNEEEELFQVECNLDDMSAEWIGYAAERLFAIGCNDVWQESIAMKKNRLGIKLCALADKRILDAALEIFATETTTGGMRFFPVRRLVAEKTMETVDTPYGKVEMKRLVFSGHGTVRLAPEYESCRKLALDAKVPLQTVYQAALAIANAREVQ